jgi:hypothetical protein
MGGVFLTALFGSSLKIAIQDIENKFSVSKPKRHHDEGASQKLGRGIRYFCAGTQCGTTPQYGPCESEFCHRFGTVRLANFPQQDLSTSITSLFVVMGILIIPGILFSVLRNMRA